MSELMATKVELGPSCAAAPGVLDRGTFSPNEERISPLPARARLNDQAVRVIRFMVSRGVSPARLAALHGVRVEAIYKLLARQTWKWVS
jgi:hypothetical protein